MHSVELPIQLNQPGEFNNPAIRQPGDSAAQTCNPFREYPIPSRKRGWLAARPIDPVACVACYRMGQNISQQLVDQLNGLQMLLRLRLIIMITAEASSSRLLGKLITSMKIFSSRRGLICGQPYH